MSTPPNTPPTAPAPTPAASTGSTTSQKIALIGKILVGIAPAIEAFIPGAAVAEAATAAVAPHVNALLDEIASASGKSTQQIFDENGVEISDLEKELLAFISSKGGPAK